MTTSRRTGIARVTRSTTPTHVYPASNRSIAAGMLRRVARMNASMKTRRPPRWLSDSLGDAPIDRIPSRRRFKIDGRGILGTYSGAWREGGDPDAHGPLGRRHVGAIPRSSIDVRLFAF